MGPTDQGGGAVPQCPNGHPVPEGKAFCGECGAAVPEHCPNGHPAPSGAEFCTVCGSPLHLPPDGARSRKLIGLLTAAVLLAGGLGVWALTAGGESKPASAMCLDGPGGVRRSGEGDLDIDDEVDVLSAELSRVDGELMATLDLAGRPPSDVEVDQALDFDLRLFAPNGEQLYTVSYGVSRFPLNNHDLEASGSEFGDARVPIEDDVPNGLTEGVPINGEIRGAIEGDTVILAVELDALPQLPQDFYWTATASASATTLNGDFLSAYDTCPVPYPSDDDGLRAEDFAAASEGTTESDDFDSSSPAADEEADPATSGSTSQPTTTTTTTTISPTGLPPGEWSAQFVSTDQPGAIGVQGRLNPRLGGRVDVYNSSEYRSLRCCYWVAGVRGMATADDAVAICRQVPDQECIARYLTNDAPYDDPPGSGEVNDDFIVYP